MAHTSFGTLLRELRIAAGMTQEELAERAGLSPRGISDLERGARRGPQLATMRLLVEALQLDSEDRTALEAAASSKHDGASRAPTRSRAAGSLPEPSTSFVGRTREQAEIQRALLSNRLITLIGVPGIGKTRLAAAVARSAGAHQAGKPVMVELGPLSDPGLVPDQLAAALGLQVHDARPVTDALLTKLADASLLIVLDNCEHVLAACSTLADALLGGCPRLRILATSRQPLGLSCEVVWPVPALTTSPPDAASGRRSATYAAEQLYVDRARAVWPSFALSSANSAAVGRVCRRLEGIPLAIELAAARTRVLSLEQIDERLEDRYRLLSAARGDAPARHQTLRAAVEWSYELLSERERLLFERLAVFRGGATLDAIEAVCSAEGVQVVDVSEVLQALVEQSLVVAQLQSDGRIRFSQLDTLREFAHARSLERGGADLLRLRHLNYYMRLAEQALPDLRGAHQVDWLDRLETEHDNVRAALGWAIAADAAPEDGLRLAASMALFYVTRGSVTEGRRWLNALLARGLPVEPAIQVRALNGAGMLAFQSAEYDQALMFNREALSIVRQLGDRAGIASQLNQLGAITSERGDRSGAWALFEESLALSRELADQPGIAVALGNLGITARLLGRLDEARDFLEQAVTMLKALGISLGTIGSVHSLGNVARDRGDLAHAEACFREALLLARAMRDWTAVARCMESLAEIMVMQRSDLARAAQLLGAAEALREETGIPPTSSGRARHELWTGTLERLLGSAAMTAARRRGRSLRRDRAVSLALARA